VIAGRELANRSGTPNPVLAGAVILVAPVLLAVGALTTFSYVTLAGYVAVLIGFAGISWRLGATTSAATRP
jgi:hypothetical protein